MTIRITRVLSDQEYIDMGDWAVKNGFFRNDRRVFTPGMAWFNPWYYDPTGERVRLNKHVMFKEPPKEPFVRGFLSGYYWRDWSMKRAPVSVVCPNGEVWEIDRWSSNGTGWVVTGDLPNISCSPSIVVEGYHGFLGGNGAPPGQFTADIEGRGPTGITRTYETRETP